MPDPYRRKGSLASVTRLKATRGTGREHER